VHALLASGPDGRAWIPGTSLAGALRDMVGKEAASRIFGLELGDGDTDPQASQVWVLGSRRHGTEVLCDGTEVRAATKINRVRAVAETNMSILSLAGDHFNDDLEFGRGQRLDVRSSRSRSGSRSSGTS
jgi:hypothetical protein